MSDTKRKVSSILPVQLCDAKPKTVIPLKLNEDFDSRDLSLMEVPKELAELLNKGDEFVLKGGEDTDVVLCTMNKTYSVKMAETSNQMLLVPPANGGEEFLMEASIKNYYELKPTMPRTGKMKELLMKSIYTGLEMETDGKMDTLSLFYSFFFILYSYYY